MNLPRLRSGITRVELDGDVVLHDPASDGVFRLDRLGALVVELLEGEADVDAVVDDLAAAFATSAAQIRDDIDGLVASLERANLLAGTAAPAKATTSGIPSADPPPTRYVVDPPAPCGANDTLVWAPTFAVDLGGVRAGIRANTATVAQGLVDLLADRVVGDDRAAPPSYSVHLSPRPAGLHLLYRDKCLQVRSADPERVLRALLRHLGAHAGGEAGLVAVEAVAVVGPSGATLLPIGWTPPVAQLRRRLASVGVVAAEVPFSTIDVDRAELVIGPDLAGEEGALARLVGSAPPVRQPDPIPPAGRYPLRRWLFPSFGYVEPEICSRAVATVQAARSVRGPLDEAGPELLARFGRMFATTRAELIPMLLADTFSTLAGDAVPTGRGR